MKSFSCFIFPHKQTEQQQQIRNRIKFSISGLWISTEWAGDKQKEREKEIIYYLLLIFCIQVRIVFLYWLPCILRMNRPGGNPSMEYPPTPSSDNLERKTTNIQDVELRER